MAELVALEEYYCNYYFNDFIHQKDYFNFIKLLIKFYYIF